MKKDGINTHEPDVDAHFRRAHVDYAGFCHAGFSLATASESIFGGVRGTRQTAVDPVDVVSFFLLTPTNM